MKKLHSSRPQAYVMQPESTQTELEVVRQNPNEWLMKEFSTFCEQGNHIALERCCNIDANNFGIFHKFGCGRTVLHLAALGNRPRCCRVLLDAGAVCDALDDHSRTPLMLTKHQGVVRMLVRHGANVHARDNDGWTALHHAAFHSRQQALQDLVAAGADLNAANEAGQTALMLAVKRQSPLAWKLVVLGADVNATDNEGMTPLHYLSRYGFGMESFQSVEALVGAKASLEATDKQGRTPLLAAVARGNQRICSHLLHFGARVDVQDRNGRTPLSIAYHKRDAGLCCMLIENGADFKSAGFCTSVLFTMALNTGSQEVACQLLQANVDIGLIEKQSQFPGGSSALIAATTMGQTQIACALINAGVSVDAQDGEGNTALVVAAMLGYDNILTHLLDAGANIGLRNSRQQTALHVATEAGRTHTACLLVSASSTALLQLMDDNGDTALAVAAKEGDGAVCCELLQHGAIMSESVCLFSSICSAARGGNAVIIERLAAIQPAAVKQSDINGLTPLRSTTQCASCRWTQLNGCSRPEQIPTLAQSAAGHRSTAQPTCPDPFPLLRLRLVS